MRRTSKVQIILIALALLNSFAGDVVFGALASWTATRATKTVLITDNSSNAKTNSSKPQPSQSSGYAIVKYQNGTKIIFPHGLPANYTPFKNASMEVFTTSYLSLGIGASMSGSVRTQVIIISPYWFFLKNFFETMQSIREQISLLLCSVALMLELPQKKFPRLPIND